MSKIQYGFGSAGAGNRTLRRTQTAMGPVHTPTLTRIKASASSLPVKGYDPSKEELQGWINAGRCWWCESERVFKSLGGHWANAHGMDLQLPRDILEVPKRYGFICDDALKARMIERGKALYDPAKLRRKGGAKYAMSKYGMRSQLAKARNTDPACRVPFFAAAAAESRRRHDAATVHAICLVCGKEFEHLVNNDRMVCSPQCRYELLHIRAKDRKCSYPGCDNKYLAKGLCSKHYQQARQAGE